MPRNLIKFPAVGMGALFTLAVVLTTPLAAQARTELLRWTHDNATAVTGFRVHWGTASRSETGGYPNTIDVGKPNASGGVFNYSQLNVPDAQTVYIAITAYGSGLQDTDYSNEKERAPAGSPPPVDPPIDPIDPPIDPIDPPVDPPVDPPPSDDGPAPSGPPFADDFQNGLGFWTLESGAWNLSNGQLTVNAAPNALSVLGFDAPLATENQCQTIQVVNDANEAAPAFVFRANAANLSTASRYDVSFNPRGSWFWLPYANGSYMGTAEGSQAFNTSGRCNSLPCYVSACMTGSGSSTQVSLYEHGGAKPVADPSQWNGALAGVLSEDDGVANPPSSGSFIGLRTFGVSNNGTQRLDNYWAGDYTPGSPPIDPPVEDPPIDPPVEDPPVDPPVEDPPIDPPVEDPPVDPPALGEPGKPFLIQ